MSSLPQIKIDTVRMDVQKLISRSGHGMLVVFEVTNPVERAHTMTKRHVKSEATELKSTPSRLSVQGPGRLVVTFPRAIDLPRPSCFLA
jgi:hypothetical protein